MEKQNNESPSPALSKKNTDTAQSRNKNRKEVSLKTYSATPSPTIAEIATANILPPSNPLMGNKFSSPSKSDAQDRSLENCDASQRKAIPPDNKKLNIGPAQHSSHSSP